MKILIEEIVDHLLKDAKPSIYLNSIKYNLINSPLEVLARLEEVEQEKKFHPEGNVWNHVMLVVDKAAAIREYANKKKVFMLAALLHDVGKKKATIRNKSGRWISYDHDKIGADEVDKILILFNVSEDERKEVCKLIRYHMHHLYIIKNLPYGDIESLIKEVDLSDMVLLFIADRLGRLQKNYEEKSKEMKDILEILHILESEYDVNVTNVKKNVNGILEKMK